MEQPMDPARRALLVRMAALFATSALPFPLGSCARACGRSPSSRQALTFDAREWAVVEAATARLIPTDELPGAREANVVGFIDRQLAEPHFDVFKSEFEAGVSALELLAAARSGARFLEIDVEQQDEVLSALEGGEGSAGRFDAAHFFLVLFTLTLEGMFGDPVYGGNEREAGWQLLGFVPGGPRPGGVGHDHG